jgi:hypothetical protein
MGRSPAGRHPVRHPVHHVPVVLFAPWLALFGHDLTSLSASRARARGIGGVVPPSGLTPNDLVAGDVEGLHRLCLPHGEQRVEAADAGGLTVIDDGLSDEVSDGSLSSVYGHGVKPFVSHMTHNWDMEILSPLRFPCPDHRRAVRVLDLQPILKSCRPVFTR